MKNSLLLSLLASCLLLAGCEKDKVITTTTYQYQFDFDCDHDIGEYLLLPSSFDYIPYAGKSSVTFMDSLGNTMDLEFTTSTNFTHEAAMFRYNVHEDGDTITYCYRTQRQRYMLRNDIFDIRFNLDVNADPYYPDPLQEYISDEFSIWHSRPNSTGVTLVFHKTIAQRTVPMITDYLDTFETYTIFGKEFRDVHRVNFTEPFMDVHYTDEEGIVSFRDWSGKTWRFERMN